MPAIHESTLRCAVGRGNDIEMLSEPCGNLAKLVEQMIFPTMMVVRHNKLIARVGRVGVWLCVHNNGLVLLYIMLGTHEIAAKIMSWMVMPVAVGLSVDLIRHLASHSDFGQTAIS